MGCCFCTIFDRRSNEETEELFGLQVCLHHKRCIAVGLEAGAAEKFVDAIMETCAIGAKILWDEEEEINRKLAASGWTRTEETRRSFEELEVAKPK